MNTIENIFAMEDFVNFSENSVELNNNTNNPTPSASSPPSCEVSPLFSNGDDFELFLNEPSLFQDPLPDPSPSLSIVNTISPSSSVESCFSPISPFSSPAGFMDFGAAMMFPPIMINTDKYMLSQQSSVAVNQFDPNVLAVPALSIASSPDSNSSSQVKSLSSPSVSVLSCASPVPVTTKPKSKAGRKRKVRPDNPAEVEALLDIKRAKNTEAARRSRHRRMARQAQEAKEWVETQQRYEAKIDSMEKTLAAYKRKLLEAGLEIPE